MFILEKALESFDVTKKSSSDRLDVLVIKSANRSESRQLFQDTLKKNNIEFEQKQLASSSFEGTEFNIGSKKYRIIYKPTSGGSGLGAKETAVTESAAAVYCQAMMTYGNINDDSLRKAYNIADVSSSIEDILAISDDWIDSCKKTATIVNSNFGSKKMTLHRQSAWVQRLENHFKALSSKENTGMNINKWSPADIYLVSDAGATIQFEKTTNLVNLNGLLLKALLSNDIVGVSLKKISGSGKLSLKNTGKERKIIDYQNYSVGKKSFFLSKDCFIFFTESGQIQFRTFPAFQGEIKGKTASHGKIGYGVISSILRKKYGIRTPNLDETKSKIREKDENMLKRFYDMYASLAKTNLIDQNEFAQKVYELGSDFILSKYLGCSIVSQILAAKPIKGKPAVSMFISDIISYASSETDLSAPFAKVE